jgi:hypothetical protein
MPTARASSGVRAAALVLGLALAGTSCTCGPRLFSVHRQHLVTLPKEAQRRSLYLSDDGVDTAYIVDLSSGRRVVHGAEAGPLLAEITPPRMAPDTHKVFYWGLDASSGQKVVKLVADGQVIDADLARTGHFVFSQSGGHWAAIGGQEIETGPNEYKPGAVRLWADGRLVGSHPDTSMPAFSPRGGHLAYLKQDDDGIVKLVVDGQTQRAFEAPAVAASPPVKSASVGPNLTPQYQVAYLSDGRLLIVATDRDGWVVFRDATRLASYPRSVAASSDGGLAFDASGALDAAASLVPDSLVTAESAPVAAWWERPAGAGAGWRVVRDGQPVDGQTCARYANDAPPTLSADGRHVAYACHSTPEDQPNQVYVVHDGKRYGPYANVWGITLSPDGRRVAFGADAGVPDAQRPWFIVVDGKRGHLQFNRVFPPRFSPDGEHVAWIGQRDHRLILFLDHHSYASSEALVWPPTFKLGSGLSWAAARGRRVSRVDVRY